MQLSNEELEQIVRPLLPRGELMTREQAKKLVSETVLIAARACDDAERRIGEMLNLSDEQAIKLRSLIDENRSRAVETVRAAVREIFPGR